MIRDGGVATSSTAEVYLLVSVRTQDDLLYRDELRSLAGTEGLTLYETYTSSPPAGWTGFMRRLDAQMLRDVGPQASAKPNIYLCGPTAFVEAASKLLVGLGHAPAQIRAERFGPTG